MILLFAHVALAVPAIPPVTDEEKVRLEAREVVVHADITGDVITSVGYVHVALPARAVWPAVIDLKARVAENNQLDIMDEYRRDGPYDWYVKVHMTIFGFPIGFHNRYLFHPEAEYLSYTLDSLQPNDLVICDGWWRTETRGAGTLLVYSSTTEAKGYVPGWIRKWMTVNSMENLLEKMRERAERR